MFVKATLTLKLVLGVVLTLMITSGASLWYTAHKSDRQNEEAFRDKLRQITGMASSTRSWFSANVDTLVPGHDFKTLNQVPVVAAWSVAQQYVAANDMTFHTPSLRPRDPKNQPDDFERRTLEAFRRTRRWPSFQKGRKKTAASSCDLPNPCA